MIHIIMGKYDKISTSRGTVDEKNVLLKQCISNELAEANRLKRLEIMKDDDYMTLELLKEELKDQA